MGTLHSKKTLEHVNGIVFSGNTTAVGATGDEDAESSEIELGVEDLSIGDPGDDSNAFPDGPQDPPSRTSASPDAEAHHYDPSTDQQANRWQVPNSDSESAIIPPLSHPTSSAPVSTSRRQRLTPTASFSAPPPPIIEPEPQPITGGDSDIAPPPMASPGPMEDTEAMRSNPGKGRPRAKKVTKRQQSAPSGSDAARRSTRNVGQKV
jgi:hypothetical protein